MADGKVLSGETVDLIVKVVDEAIDGNIFIEMIDGPGARMLCGVVNLYGDKFIPDEYDPLINEVATLALTGKYEEAASKAGSILNKLVDVPLLDENSEELVFTNGLKFLVSLLINYIAKKKQEEE